MVDGEMPVLEYCIGKEGTSRDFVANSVAYGMYGSMGGRRALSLVTYADAIFFFPVLAF